MPLGALLTRCSILGALVTLPANLIAPPPSKPQPKLTRCLIVRDNTPPRQLLVAPHRGHPQAAVTCLVCKEAVNGQVQAYWRNNHLSSQML